MHAALKKYLKAIIFTVVYFLIMIVVGLWIYCTLHSNPESAWSAWFDFLGAYLGGGATLLGVVFTIHYEKQKASEEKETQKKKEIEEHILNVRPFLTTDISTIKKDRISGIHDRVFDIYDGKVKYARFELMNDDRDSIARNEERDDSDFLYIQYQIRNIGQGSAVEMNGMVNDHPFKYAMAQNETAYFYFLLHNKEEKNVNIDIEFDFWDSIHQGHYIKKDRILTFKEEQYGKIAYRLENIEQQKRVE